MSLRQSLFWLLLVLFISSAEAQPEITNFKSCAAAGGRVLKMFPPTCVTEDGRRFTDKDDKRSGSPNVPAEPQQMCRNLCGDGACQEIVCMGSGCPCPETKDNCPADCR